MSYFQSRNFSLEIAKGNVPKHSLITKFGLNDDVDTGSFPEDLWGVSGVYVQPTAARVHAFVSTSASDTMTIFIRGINGSYGIQTETITMNGTTPVNTVNSYVHIHLIQNTGSANNIGVITATAATDGTVTIKIPHVCKFNSRSVFHFERNLTNRIRVYYVQLNI